MASAHSGTGAAIRRVARLAWAWAPVLIWAGLILWMSSRSDLPVRTNPQTGETIRTTFTIAKIAHVVEYSILALLLLRALLIPAGGVRLAFLPAAVLTVIASGAFGALDEFRQSMTPNREPRLADVALDAVSALGACLAIAAWRRVRRRALPRSAPETGLGGEVARSSRGQAESEAAP